MVDATRELYLEERRQAILHHVQQRERASVAELSSAFSVSEVTIRADLQALADRALIVRTHGGAVANQGPLAELTMASRRDRQVREKSLIGQRAATLVQDGDAVFLDSSSTSLAIGHHLKTVRHITVITNSLAVVQELADAPDLPVIVLGGALDRTTDSLVSNQLLNELRQLNLRIGFFGAHGITMAEGLTDVSPQVAAVKRPLVDMCRETVAALDATKWGRVGVASFAEIAAIDRIVTTNDAPESLMAEVRGAGVDVLMA